jgi:hypothetical protein
MENQGVSLPVSQYKYMSEKSYYYKKNRGHLTPDHLVIVKALKYFFSHGAK